MPDGDKTSSVRNQILDEATRLFAAQGFGATSVQAIAEAVGIRKPSLLYHFESKELLRDAVLERILARWNELLPGLLVAAAKEDRWGGVMSALTTFFLEDPDRARLLLREVLDRPTELRALLVKYVRPWVVVVSEQLERARRDGFVHDDVDVEAYSVHVIHLVVGGVAVMETMGAALGGRSNVTRERMTKELMRLARAGLFVDSSVRRARSAPPAVPPPVEPPPVALASSEGTNESARARRTGKSETSDKTEPKRKRGSR